MSACTGTETDEVVQHQHQEHLSAQHDTRAGGPSTHRTESQFERGMTTNDPVPLNIVSGHASPTGRSLSLLDVDLGGESVSEAVAAATKAAACAARTVEIVTVAAHDARVAARTAVAREAVTSATNVTPYTTAAVEAAVKAAKRAAWTAAHLSSQQASSARPAAVSSGGAILQCMYRPLSNHRANRAIHFTHSLNDLVIRPNWGQAGDFESGLCVSSLTIESFTSSLVLHE